MISDYIMQYRLLSINIDTNILNDCYDLHTADYMITRQQSIV